MEAIISIIIPALNEADQIGATLQALKPHSGLEIIVVDGGSRDGTPEIVRSQGARLIATQPGKGRQMNAGAVAAGGDILLFLHADTRLPDGFPRIVRDIAAHSSVAAGAFLLRLDGPGWGLRLIERMINLRTRLLKSPYGDQAIFLKSETFRRVGGFPEIPLMEDVALIKRLKAAGRIEICRAKVVTSARRWQTVGLVKTTLLNWAVLIGFALGVSPERLAGWYRNRRRLGKEI